MRCEADHPAVTAAGLWDHFRTVTVPAIMECQAVQEEGTSEASILDTIVAFAHYYQKQRANSEVTVHVTCMVVLRINACMSLSLSLLQQVLGAAV